MHETDESEVKVAATYDDMVSAPDDALSVVARNQQQEKRPIRRSKRLQVGRNCDADESNSLKVGTINKEDTSVDDKELLPSDKIGRESKWEQSEAFKLFLGRPLLTKEQLQRQKTTSGGNSSSYHERKEQIDLCEELVKQIRILRRAFRSHDGWKDMVDGENHEMCTSYEVHKVQIISRYLSMVYVLSLDLYERNDMTFTKICKLAASV